MDKKLQLTRYGVISHGVTPRDGGWLLDIVEVIDALEFILDDDEAVQDNANKLLENLRLIDPPKP